MLKKEHVAIRLPSFCNRNNHFPNRKPMRWLGTNVLRNQPGITVAGLYRRMWRTSFGDWCRRLLPTANRIMLFVRIIYSTLSASRTRLQVAKQPTVTKQCRRRAVSTAYCYLHHPEFQSSHVTGKVVVKSYQFRLITLPSGRLLQPAVESDSTRLVSIPPVLPQ